jgi:hypothetical protein
MFLHFDIDKYFFIILRLLSIIYLLFLEKILQKKLNDAGISL